MVHDDLTEQREWRAEHQWGRGLRQVPGKDAVYYC